MYYITQDQLDKMFKNEELIFIEQQENVYVFENYLGQEWNVKLEN